MVNFKYLIQFLLIGFVFLIFKSYEFLHVQPLKHLKARYRLYALDFADFYLFKTGKLFVPRCGDWLIVSECNCRLFLNFVRVHGGVAGVWCGVM